VLAKSLVRNRQYVTKMHRMKANLQAVSLKITVRPPLAGPCASRLRLCGVLNAVCYTAKCRLLSAADAEVCADHADAKVHRRNVQGDGWGNQGMQQMCIQIRSLCNLSQVAPWPT
jgi:hypothetical protein